MARFYIAAAWSRRLEALDIANKLRGIGAEITSNWLTEEGDEELQFDDVFLRDRAYIDLTDIDSSDALVRLTDHPALYEVGALRKLVSGARMVEMGYALARGKTIYVIGGRQCIFDRLPQVIHFANVEALLVHLGG